METTMKPQSFKPFIVFSAFLVLKFWPKKVNLGKNYQKRFFTQILVIFTQILA